jgi:TolB protein
VEAMQRLAVSIASCLAFGCGACGGDSRPLDSAARASLTGFIYYHSTDELTVARRVKPDGTGDRALTDGNDAAFVYPADKKSIFIVENDDVFIARPDGTEKRALATSEGFDWYPRLSPDGARVLFESSRASFRDLYLVPSAGGDATRLTDDREGNFDASWSPDGKQIAFSSSRYGQLDLFVATSEMKDIRRLTQHPGDAVKPSWSKSGNWIAFLSRRDGEEDLFVIRANGTDIENLTREVKGEVLSYEWHPSEDRLLVATKVGRSAGKLHAIDVASKSIETLSGSDHDDSDPDWSPDGRFLAFTSKVQGRPDIWIMRADGKQRTRLTSDARGAWLPRWIEVEGR